MTQYPLCRIENVGEPHHWVGHVYAIKVPPTWKPCPEKSDGEAGEIRWWNTAGLRAALTENQEQFMVLSVPPLFVLLDRLDVLNDDTL